MYQNASAVATKIRLIRNGVNCVRITLRFSRMLVACSSELVMFAVAFSCVLLQLLNYIGGWAISYGNIAL
jgi:hypothetical protein